MTKKPQPDRSNPEFLVPQVEAALFATAEPISLGHLADMLGTSQRATREALERLVTDYHNRPNAALEIAITEDGFIIQVKPLYQKIVDRLLPTDLPQSTLRTLTLIAAREPVMQKDIVDARGSSAYDHIKELAERGLVRKDPRGPSFELRVGPRFGDYFRLDEDQLSDYLAKLRKQANKVVVTVSSQEPPPVLQDAASPDLLGPASPDLLDPASPDLLDPASPDLLDPASPDLLDPASPDLLGPASPGLLESLAPAEMNAS